MSDETRMTGGCMCGAVRYETTGKQRNAPDDRFHATDGRLFHPNAALRQCL